jgi:hypothetical protein
LSDFSVIFSLTSLFKEHISNAVPKAVSTQFKYFAALCLNFVISPQKGIDRLMEAVSPNAFYDSDNRADPPKCHPNTRVAVINKIIDWAMA